MVAIKVYWGLAWLFERVFVLERGLVIIIWWGVVLPVVPWPAVEVGTLLVRPVGAALDYLRGRVLRAVGEMHEDPASVMVARETLMGACRESSRVALAVEYFNVEQQSLLDGWVAGRITWRVLLEKYRAGPEGFPLEKYRPLLEAARSCGARIVGVMPPRSVASMVARSGRLPGRAGGYEVDPRPEAWPGYARALARLFPRSGPMARIPVERLLLAQSYKDSVAAGRVVGLLEDGYIVVLVMGWAHVELPGAVVERVASRLGMPRESVGVVGVRRLDLGVLDVEVLSRDTIAGYLVVAGGGYR